MYAEQLAAICGVVAGSSDRQPSTLVASSRDRARCEATSLGLDPLDRMLLSTDGTVTTLLKACTGDAIVTVTTRVSGPAPLDRLRAATGCWWHPDAQLLGLAPPERLIARRVVLRGARSDVAYVLAEALVVPDRLPDGFAGQLERAGASLGSLLVDTNVATRRQILDVVSVRAAEAADYLDVEPGATLARRTYTILVDRRPVAAVSEWLCPGRLAAHTRMTARRGIQSAGFCDQFVVDL